MPLRRPLDTGTAWTQLESTPQDWEDAGPQLLGTMLSELHLVRAFEESVLELAGDGLVHGPRTPASGRRAARSGRSSGCAPATR